MSESVRPHQCYQWRMAEHGKRPKFRLINMPLCLMVPPWQASLHKLAMAVGKKSATPFRHGGYFFNMDRTLQLYRIEECESSVSYGLGETWSFHLKWRMSPLMTLLSGVTSAIPWLFTVCGCSTSLCNGWQLCCFVDLSEYCGRIVDVKICINLVRTWRRRCRDWRCY